MVPVGSAIAKEALLWTLQQYDKQHGGTLSEHLGWCLALQRL